jgi:hypothetical protein
MLSNFIGFCGIEMLISFIHPSLPDFLREKKDDQQFLALDHSMPVLQEDIRNV